MLLDLPPKSRSNYHNLGRRLFQTAFCSVKTRPNLIAINLKPWDCCNHTPSEFCLTLHCLGPRTTPLLCTAHHSASIVVSKRTQESKDPWENAWTPLSRADSRIVPGRKKTTVDSCCQGFALEPLTLTTCQPEAAWPRWRSSITRAPQGRAKAVTGFGRW